MFTFVADEEALAISETLDSDFSDEERLPDMQPGNDLLVPMAFKPFLGEVHERNFDR